jgi:restriction system protein
MKFKMAPNSLFAILLRKPWWISLVVASAITVMALGLLPADLRVVGALGALPFYVISLIACVRQWRAPSAREIEAMTQAVATMGWPEFSRSLTQAYVRLGYAVRPMAGGADLVIERDGRKCLVAARRWKAARHGEESVQALLDALAREDAGEGCYLAIGELSANAQRLLRQHGVQVVQIPQLVPLLRGIVPAAV